MSYTLKSLSTNEYIQIWIEGIWPSENTGKLIKEVYQIWAKEKISNLLIDIRNMEDTPSVFRDYETAARFAKEKFYQVGRIAVLDNLDRKEANDFFELTAGNRGIRFRFFYKDEQEAINWLTKL